MGSSQDSIAAVASIAPIQKRTSVDQTSTMRSAEHLMSAAEGITSAGDSARFRQRLAVDARLALQIVDCDVGVVPSEPRPGPMSTARAQSSIAPQLPRGSINR
jgi:hypothetical protein